VALTETLVVSASILAALACPHGPTGTILEQDLKVIGQLPVPDRNARGDSGRLALLRSRGHGHTFAFEQEAHFLKRTLLNLRYSTPA